MNFFLFSISFCILSRLSSADISQIIATNYDLQNENEVKFMKYEPTWDSLDKRPLPKWYDEAKIGKK